LKEKNLFVDFYWVGEKTNRRFQEKLSNINNIFLGFLEEKDMAKYYSRAHLYLLPTLADNLPNTLLESLASGTGVVCFNVGGCAEAVKNKETGYLAERGNIDDFVKGIMFFLERPGSIQQIGDKGRKLVLDKFTLEKQTRAYFDLIKNILI
jgi:glycosyltransferase involved in cell wall biosynthesis